ncbi:MAG: hypothetical protein ABW148_07060 [Sedimenticola sp.]
MDSGITKIEAAQRQLVTAIELFFRNGDPVSIHSLATNAWEVIDALCTNYGVDSVSDDTRGHIVGSKDLKFDYINSPYRNFFKHSDRDPNSVLEGFNDEKNDSIIFLGVEDYIRLRKTSPIELQVYQLWYLALNTDKVAHDALAEILETLEAVFPDIKSIGRAEQKRLGLELIEQYKNDEELNAHAKVESAFHRLF